MDALRYHYTNSFKYRKSLQNIFSDVLGLHFIDYLSIADLTATTVTIYSSEPALEANLVESGLIKHDRIYTNKHPDNLLLIWDNYYHEKTDEIRQIKTLSNKFQFGFSIFHTDNQLYSFATKNNMENAVQYYSDRLDDLYVIGKHCYKQLKDRKILEQPETAKILSFKHKEQKQYV